MIENREYITSIHNVWIFYKFPDGKESCKRVTNIKDLQELLEWYTSEFTFYTRMYRELVEIYNIKYSENQDKHLYSIEEMNACGYNISKKIDMEISNAELMKNLYKVSGMGEMYRIISNKVTKYSRLAYLTQIAINNKVI